MKTANKTTISFKNILFLTFIISTIISCKQKKTCNLDNKNSNYNNISSEYTINTFYSKELNRKWTYSIYLPTSFQTDSTQKIEVLYLLHGHGGNETSWMASGEIKYMIDSLILKNSIRKIAIVMPDGGNSWYVDGNEKMESAIIKDLIPEIENTYSFSSDAKLRSIGGMSAGGYGSLRLVLKYPQLFSNAILMSPAIYSPTPDFNSFARTEVPSFRNKNNQFSDSIWRSLNYMNYWGNFEKEKQLKHSFYLSTGSTDCFTGIILAVNSTLPSELSKRHLKFTVKNYKGGHEMSVWKQALKEALIKIYKK